MAWIPMIPEDKAEKELKNWYDNLRELWGCVNYGEEWIIYCVSTV